MTGLRERQKAGRREDILDSASLLFRRDKYSTLFYRWAERLLNKEWQTARWQYVDPPPLPRRARLLTERAICRVAVAVLGKVQGQTMPLRLTGA